METLFERQMQSRGLAPREVTINREKISLSLQETLTIAAEFNYSPRVYRKDSLIEISKKQYTQMIEDQKMELETLYMKPRPMPEDEFDRLRQQTSELGLELLMLNPDIQLLFNPGRRKYESVLQSLDNVRIKRTEGELAKLESMFALIPRFAPKFLEDSGHFLYEAFKILNEPKGDTEELGRLTSNLESHNYFGKVFGYNPQSDIIDVMCLSSQVLPKYHSIQTLRQFFINFHQFWDQTGFK